jgi:hypothetical protein
MPQHLRIHRRNFPNAAVLIPVQVTAAHTHRANPDGDLAGARIGRLRHFAFFKDARGEELNGSHARKPYKPDYLSWAYFDQFRTACNVVFNGLGFSADWAFNA